jgi:cytochrome c-type biogenesis protein CcmH
MVFWIVCSVLALVAAGLVITPLLRPASAEDTHPDIAIYKAQLTEIDRDLERDVLAKDEAERARTEIARRLLAASKADTAPLSARRPATALSLGIGAVVVAIAFGIYLQIGAPGYGDVPLDARLATSDEMRANRPSQAELEAAAPTLPPVEPPADYLAAIEQLRAIAPQRPDDLEAWSLLAFHEAGLRNYAAAAAAQQRVIDIKGAAATTTDFEQLLDLQVVAAGGLVSPEAEVLIRTLLDEDENNPAGRYYLGALYNQTDRPDLAYRLWRDMAENGDPETFHVASARAQIEDAAFRAGIEYSLPTVRGPSSADIANAQNMTAEERQEMIGGMVAGRADRLANEGGPATDWARLITAYGVMGDTENARAIWVEAADVFGTDAPSMQVLTEAARQAGVLE